MFGFLFISVGLHFAQFSLSEEELVLFINPLLGFHLWPSVDGRGRLARVTDGEKPFRP